MVNAPSTLFRAAALVAALASSTVVGAAEREIVNTAQARWDAGGRTRTTESNTVRVTMEARAEAATPVVQLLRFQPDGPVRMAVDGTRCASRRDADSTLSPGVSGLSPFTGGSPGTPFVIAVDRPDANRDPTTRERLVVTVASKAGDHETFSLLETEADSGRFAGVVPTVATPPPAVPDDCSLSLVSSEERITVAAVDGEPFGTFVIAVAPVRTSVVFDSATGGPVAGAMLTLVDADTGAPVGLFSPNGSSVPPAPVTTGSDGAWTFGLVPPGRYRVRVAPPTPYVGPSVATPEELAALGAFRVTDGSYGGTFALTAPGPLDFDVPLDRPSSGLLLTKKASVSVAQAGDRILYSLDIANADPIVTTGKVTITDRLPRGLTLVASSVRITSGAVETTSVDGQTIRFTVPRLRGGETRVLRYLAEVRPDARAGVAINKAQASDARGLTSPVADVSVRIAPDRLAQRTTLVGRVTVGGCQTSPVQAVGIGGVRLILEDGSYAVTDLDGRYHFDGVTPRTHVVQLDTSTLADGLVPVDCARDPRSAGNAASRFVRSFGGGLARADFRLTDGPSTGRLGAKVLERPTVPTDAQAAGGGEVDWFSSAAGQAASGVEWLLPTPDYNPRARVTRVVIRHAPEQSIELSRDGAPVPALNSDGTRTSADGLGAVTVWRGLELFGRDTRFTALVRNADGSVAQRLERTVHFAELATHAELLRDRSLLVADGVSRPVLAVRFTDAAGRPLHHGATGAFSLPEPYLADQVADALQARQLGGLERAPASWRIEGDDGVAFITLEPTTASGSLTLTLPFRDGEHQREERLDLWLDPGDRPWTVVGLAEGSAGFSTLSDHLETATSHERLDGRLALYAKGRVLGRWLLTLAYDTDAERRDERFGGAIDPTAYYTVYADGSERRFDAGIGAQALPEAGAAAVRRPVRRLSDRHRPTAADPLRPRLQRRAGAVRQRPDRRHRVCRRHRIPHAPRRDPGQRPVRPLLAGRPRAGAERRADRDRGARPPALQLGHLAPRTDALSRLRDRL